ncbi:MAG TPA: glycosyltransferase family 2 protein [Candidatus Bacteroides pullicola]|uniref:Glycosyltransferase family 2 protein n=1 Tax=Candidatus Bacteroides pullicola TaxID=2838475 RepID=A0A9D2CLY1_9BACE|nr:glycosyltransferase family 2 protein [Candidatus Bacteroides pullicola]
MWCVVIPTYNNAGTIRRVVEEVCRQTCHVIVVDDGSTDGTADCLKDLDILLLRHARNRGKGRALQTGLRHARFLGFDEAITLDADGQHFAEDIPVLLQAAGRYPGSMVVGSRNLAAEGMPARNTFANRFSNFWFRLHTGIRLPDTQTGFRLYPLRRMGSLWWLTARYEAELEMLVWAAWRGIPLVPVPVRVWYPPEGERVSHFRPGWDFARISLLNTVLCGLAVVYGWPARLLRLCCRREI